MSQRRLCHWRCQKNMHSWSCHMVTAHGWQFSHRGGFFKKNMHLLCRHMFLPPGCSFSHKVGWSKKKGTRGKVSCLTLVFVDVLPKAKGRVLARGRGCWGSQTFAPLGYVDMRVLERGKGQGVHPLLPHIAVALPFLPSSFLPLLAGPWAVGTCLVQGAGRKPATHPSWFKLWPPIAGTSLDT